MDQNNDISPATASTLSELVVRVGNENLTVLVVGEGSGPAAKAMLEYVARVEGRMICVNSFPDVLGQATALKLNPTCITVDQMLRFARRANCADYLTISNGDAGELGRLLAPGSVDMLFLACANSYDELREHYLAFLPALRHGGLVVGTGYQAAPAGAGLDSILRASAPAGNPALASYVVTRFVDEFHPDATIEDDLWVAEYGLAEAPVAQLASRMRSSRDAQRRAARSDRALLAGALRICKESESPQQRIAMLEQLACEYPELLDVHLMLGGEYLELGLCEEAIQIYQRPMQNRKGNADLYGKIGNAYKVMGDLGQAETYLLASLRYDPALLPSWLSLAMLYVEIGDPARAIDSVAHGLEVVPPDIGAVSILARMSLALGDPGTMATALNRVRRLDPEHELAGKLAVRLGDHTLAIQPVAPAPAPVPHTAMS